MEKTIRPQFDDLEDPYEKLANAKTIAKVSPVSIDGEVSPAVEELSGEYKDKVDFVKVNVDQNNELAQKYSIFSIPTLTIFAKGKVIAQAAGAASKDKIRSYIDSNIN